MAAQAIKDNKSLVQIGVIETRSITNISGENEVTFDLDCEILPNKLYFVDLQSNINVSGSYQNGAYDSVTISFLDSDGENIYTFEDRMNTTNPGRMGLLQFFETYLMKGSTYDSRIGKKLRITFNPKSSAEITKIQRVECYIIALG